MNPSQNNGVSYLYTGQIKLTINNSEGLPRRMLQGKKIMDFESTSTRALARGSQITKPIVFEDEHSTTWFLSRELSNDQQGATINIFLHERTQHYGW